MKSTEGTATVESYKEQVLFKLRQLTKQHSDLVRQMSLVSDGIHHYERVIELLEDNSDAGGYILDVIKELYPVN